MRLLLVAARSRRFSWSPVVTRHRWQAEASSNTSRPIDFDLAPRVKYQRWRLDSGGCKSCIASPLYFTIRRCISIVFLNISMVCNVVSYCFPSISWYFRGMFAISVMGWPWMGPIRSLWPKERVRLHKSGYNVATDCKRS